MNIATIKIKNLRLRTYIGIKQEEINNRQDVIINIELEYDCEAAVKENNIESALNYRTICKAVINLIEGERFALLEKMTHEVLRIVMSNTHVLCAKVEIDKVGALRYSDSVSITQSGYRKQKDTDWITTQKHSFT